MNGEGSPLRGAGVKVVVVHVKVARADRLRAKSVEQRHFGPAGNAYCGVVRNQWENEWLAIHVTTQERAWSRHVGSKTHGQHS